MSNSITAHGIKLDKNGLHVMQLTLVLTTNWGDTGSVDEYVNWSSTATVHEQFYTDQQCQTLYKGFVRTVLTRVNTINGRT